MSNKSRLQTNNTNLQALINKANALPDAGGGGAGGSVETYNLYIMTGIATSGRFAAYTTLDSSGNLISTVLENCGGVDTPLVCVCNTPIVFYRNDAYGSEMMLNGDLSLLYSKNDIGLYVFEGGTQPNTDCYIRFIPV